MALPLLSAILGILAFLPFDYFWLLGFIFLVPFIIFLIEENKFWRIILGSFIFRLIFASGTVYFSFEPIAWISSILIFLGLPISVFIAKRKLTRLFATIIKTDKNWPIILFIPFLWTIYDHIQAHYSFLPTHIITAGNILGSSPFLGLAAIGGPITLTFFAAIVNTFITILILRIIKNKSCQFADFMTIIFIVFVILSAFTISKLYLKKNSFLYKNLPNSLKIAAISVNEKFDIKNFDQLKNELDKEKTDLIIFPENIFERADFFENFTSYQNLSRELKTNLISTFDTSQNNKKYNSTILFNKEGWILDARHKNRLTFIGEYWPFSNWEYPFLLNYFKNKYPKYAAFNPQNSYSKGEKRILIFKNGQSPIKFAIPICLEIYYPNDLKKYKKLGAQFIVNPTSNRWLELGTKHFLYLSNNFKKIESIWLKIPIISSGVKDYAGIIAPDGEDKLTNYESDNKNFRIFFGEIKY